MIVAVSFLILAGAFFAFNGDRHTKNLFYDFVGFGDCPNCGDSWDWKESGNIYYKTLIAGEDYTVGGNNAVFSHVIYSVMICKECLSKPESLDVNTIEQDLIAADWDI